MLCISPGGRWYCRKYSRKRGVLAQGEGRGDGKRQPSSSPVARTCALWREAEARGGGEDNTPPAQSMIRWE